jgi:shikimate dehydrogenase
VPAPEFVAAGIPGGGEAAAHTARRALPDRYGLIGHPVAHSLSPRIHALFAQQTGEPVSYVAMDVLPQQLVPQVQEFFAAGGRGLNVTVPHKQAVVTLAHELTARARRAGAVNTLTLDITSGRLLGDTTDGAGLVHDLIHNLRLTLQSRRLLLVGAGGAARGVLEPLLACRPRELVIANRSLARAAALAQDWQAAGPVRAAPLELPGETAFDLIVHATAAGLQAQSPALPAGIVGPGTICYDMSYGSRPSPFIRWAQRSGATQCHMGLGMLVEQAAESFQAWRGVRPQTAPVLAALRATGEAL